MCKTYLLKCIYLQNFYCMIFADLMDKNKELLFANPVAISIPSVQT